MFNLVNIEEILIRFVAIAVAVPVFDPQRPHVRLQAKVDNASAEFNISFLKVEEITRDDVIVTRVNLQDLKYSISNSIQSFCISSFFFFFLSLSLF